MRDTDIKPQPIITWTRPLLDRFKERYRSAVQAHELDFQFDGKTFVTDYAKFVIEYVETRL
jgi:hypothetical protein